MRAESQHPESSWLDHRKSGRTSEHQGSSLGACRWSEARLSTRPRCFWRPPLIQPLSEPPSRSNSAAIGNTRAAAAGPKPRDRDGRSDSIMPHVVHRPAIRSRRCSRTHRRGPSRLAGMGRHAEWPAGASARRARSRWPPCEDATTDRIADRPQERRACGSLVVRCALSRKRQRNKLSGRAWRRCASLRGGGHGHERGQARPGPAFLSDQPTPADCASADGRCCATGASTYRAGTNFPSRLSTIQKAPLAHFQDRPSSCPMTSP